MNRRKGSKLVNWISLPGTRGFKTFYSVRLFGYNIHIGIGKTYTPK